MRILNASWLRLRQQIKLNQRSFSFLNWFAIGNMVVFCFLFLPYLNIIMSSQTLFIESTFNLYTLHERILLTTGLILAYLGQTALLAYLPSILLLPIAFLVKRRRIIALLAILLSTISIVL